MLVCATAPVRRASTSNQRGGQTMKFWGSRLVNSTWSLLDASSLNPLEKANLTSATHYLGTICIRLQLEFDVLPLEVLGAIIMPGPSDVASAAAQRRLQD